MFVFAHAATGFALIASLPRRPGRGTPWRASLRGSAEAVWRRLQVPQLRDKDPQSALRTRTVLAEFSESDGDSHENAPLL